MCVITCCTKVASLSNNTIAGLMFSKDDTDFIDFLFGKLTCLTDMDDLNEDDDTAGSMALEIEAARLEMTVDELVQHIHGCP